MRDFRELSVWNKSHQLTLDCYGATKTFPRDELYGLVSQIRRASASIGCNIAEGCGRSGNGDFQRFLQLAAGSASEVEYELLLSHDLGYIPSETYVALSAQTIEIKKMLTALSRKVEIARFQDRGERI